MAFLPENASAGKAGSKARSPKASHTTKKKKGSTWENFTYSIVALNQRAGVANARVEKDKRGRPTVLYAESETIGTVAKAFPMDHRQVSHIRKGKSYPKKTLQKRDDPFGKMSLKVLFPKKGNKPTLVSSHKKGRDRSRKRILPRGVHDPLSALLQVASRKTSPGDTWELPMFSGVKLYGVRAKTLKREDLWTPGLGMHSAHKIQLTVYREPQWTQKGKKGFKITSPAKDGWTRIIELWVSADKSGIVMKAVYQIQPLGEVQVVLESFHVEKAVSKKRSRKKS